MRNVPSWPEWSPVVRPSTQVFVNGGSRDVDAVSVKAEVSGGSGVSPRTGSVVWSQPDVVQRVQESVFSASVPKRGDRVSVDAGVGGVHARLFTGRVDTTDVEVPGGVSSEIVDYWDRLNREVSIPSLMQYMPPYENMGDPRRVGLSATWVTQRALALCGFHATPPVRNGSALSASLNGSLWPEVGSVTSITGDEQQAWYASPWGECPEGFNAAFGGGDRSMAHGPLEVSFLIDDSVKTGTSHVDVRFTDGNIIRLLVQGGGLVAAQYGTTPSTVVSLNTTERGGNELVVLKVEEHGAWTLSSGSTVKTGTRTLSEAAKGVPSSIWVTVPLGGRNIGGVNVAYTNVALPAWGRTAIIDGAESSIRASRGYVNTPAVDILAERAKAEGARMWIDADSVFHWVRRDRWGAGAPVATIADADLLGYGMRVDFDSVYSEVKVKNLEPSTQTRRMPNVTLYEGSSNALGPGDDMTLFIETPDDEDWPQVDPSMDIIGQTGTAYDFNRSRGSWGGGTRVAGDGEIDYWAQGPEGQFTDNELRQISSRKWVYTISARANMNPLDIVETRTVRQENHVGDTGLWSRWDSVALPILRGWAKVSWEEASQSAMTGADSLLPVLEHDAGWWVQGAYVASLRDWLAAKYATPVVILSGVKIVPDARIELGDVLTLTDSTYAGMTARAVVTGIDYSTRNGEASMSLDVEILSIDLTKRTYDSVQAESNGATYAAFQALIGAVPYSVQEA